jgi:ATP/maltotriose-dependent transcriptional regulator MalT
VEIHDSARKHRVVNEDIHHAIDHALAIEDPDRWLVVGPDRAGNLLEVAVLTTVEDTQLAIHAMPIRAKFRRLLEP